GSGGAQPVCLRRDRFGGRAPPGDIGSPESLSSLEGSPAGPRGRRSRGQPAGPTGTPFLSFRTTLHAYGCRGALCARTARSPDRPGGNATARMALSTRTPIPSDLLTLEEAAVLANVHRDTVRAWCACGRVPRLVRERPPAVVHGRRPGRPTRPAKGPRGHAHRAQPRPRPSGPL